QQQALGEEVAVPVGVEQHEVRPDPADELGDQLLRVLAPGRVLLLDLDAGLLLDDRVVLIELLAPPVGLPQRRLDPRGRLGGRRGRGGGRRGGGRRRGRRGRRRGCWRRRRRRA